MQRTYRSSSGLRPDTNSALCRLGGDEGLVSHGDTDISMVLLLVTNRKDAYVVSSTYDA